MAIPDYETVMLPVLKIVGDGQEHRIRDVIEQLARDSALTDEERRELLPSGKACSRGAAEVATSDVGATGRACPRHGSGAAGALDQSQCDGQTDGPRRNLEPPRPPRLRVQESWRRHGYGGSRADAGQIVGRSGDGVIDQDPSTCRRSATGFCTRISPDAGPPYRVPSPACGRGTG
jgi:hypothetical protein